MSVYVCLSVWVENAFGISHKREKRSYMIQINEYKTSLRHSFIFLLTHADSRSVRVNLQAMAIKAFVLPETNAQNAFPGISERLLGDFRIHFDHFV